jgi:ferredoxin-nitrite reductase
MKTVDTIIGASQEMISDEQKTYLEGFLAGVGQRSEVFADLFPGGIPGVATNIVLEEDAPLLILEERIKKEEHPLDVYHRVIENALTNKAPDKEDVFRFKWNGLFFQSPISESYMARLRIPGGQLKSFQLREIAAVSKELTSGYIQVTTRANLQIRTIEPKQAPEVLRRIQSIGLHTRGAGADNIRNITSGATAGFDPVELIDCTPYVHDLAQIIIGSREFYDLPRKFNVAFDGGGLVSTVEDTNDIGAKAVRYSGEVFFRIALGGATGHQAFAGDMGVLLTPDELIPVILAILRVFIREGNRSNRKKARLKHLLEKIPMEPFRKLVEERHGKPLRLINPEDAVLEWPSAELDHSHVGLFPQNKEGLYYLGLTIPVGQLTPRQLGRIADLADQYGSGDIRLTVWQNIIIPNIPLAWVETVKKGVEKIGLGWKQSHVSSGVIACTGSRYCKFASTDTKAHAISLMKYLEKKLQLDQPVNIHLTGCPNSCAQHYMGDIGLLGCKNHQGEEAYHVFVGGGFGQNQACGRQVYQSLSATEMPTKVETMLRVWLDRREGKESFQSFTARHDVNSLQVLFEGS